MNTNLQVFNFESHSIRTVEIDGVVWFVAKDICEVLSVSNVSDSLTRLDEDERKKVDFSDIATTDGVKNQQLNATQQVWVINESGLYSLVLTSRKPEAKVFKKWITSEVLPSIRKTGSYSISTPKTYIQALEALVESEKEKELLKNKIEKDEPYTNLARIITSQNAITRRDWVALMKDNSGVNVKERELTDFLITNKYCYRDQLNKELRAYADFAKYFKLEYGVINNYSRALLKVTGEGVLVLTPMIVNHFKNLKANTTNTIMNAIVASTISNLSSNIDIDGDSDED